MMEQWALFVECDLAVQNVTGQSRNAHAGRNRNRLVAENARPRETPAPVDRGWTLEPHICRRCIGGRLLSRPGQKMRAYCCSNCGETDEASGPEVLCFCGMKVQRNGATSREVDLGIRCHANPSPSPEFPSLIVASEKSLLAEK